MLLANVFGILIVSGELSMVVLGSGMLNEGHSCTFTFNETVLLPSVMVIVFIPGGLHFMLNVPLEESVSVTFASLSALHFIFAVWLPLYEIL